MHASDRTVVCVLGRFAVLRDGIEVPIPPGQPRTLVKFLATRHRGRAHSEQAIEALWPGISPDRGRKLLRGVLHRLRDGCGELIVREGETLSFGAEVEIDARLFENDARRALDDTDDPDAVSIAREAAARYDELLPDDPYEHWVTTPRDRLRLRYLSLLDVLIAAARSSGNVKEERAALERAMEVDPEDLSRLLDTAASFRAQGNQLAADAILARARRAMRAAGLPDLPDLGAA